MVGFLEILVYWFICVFAGDNASGSFAVREVQWGCDDILTMSVKSREKRV